MEFPLVVVRQYSLIRDSGGAGKFRGGQGICREFEARFDNVSYTGLGDRQIFPPWGLSGGENGACGAYHLTRTDGTVEKLPSKCTEIILNAGDIVSVQTPGAGGYGDPGKRDPQAVLSDVIEDKVSVEKAMELYGVKVVPSGNTYKLAE